MARGEDDRLDALGLTVDDVGDGLHGAPRLAEEVELVEVQVLAQGDEFVDPGLLGPQFGMTVEVGVAAADLVVGDDLAARVGDAVQHFEIVMRAAWSTVQTKQCRLA